MAEKLAHKILGPFHLAEQIGQGGVSEVYRAFHSDTRKEVAVKVMHEAKAGDKQQRDAFRAEFELLQSLEHPGLPKAYRLGAIQDRPAMAIEYIGGRTLYALRGEEVHFDRVGAMLAMIHIVAHLHQNDVVHNDLKPENFILQESGRLCLIDFGNARRVCKPGLLGRFFKKKQKLFGTPSYLAPELITGGEADFRSDCYALGIAVFFLLTGETPFGGDRRTIVLNRAVKQDAASVCDLVPRLPKSLGKVIDSCMLKDPDRRPPDAVALKTLVRGQFGSGFHASPMDLSKQLFEDFEHSGTHHALSPG